MVQKFLTRESMYSSLLIKVSELERHMEELKKDNEVLKEKLNDLHIDSQHEDDKSLLEKFKDDEEIMQLRQKIDEKKKDL